MLLGAKWVSTARCCSPFAMAGSCCASSVWPARASALVGKAAEVKWRCYVDLRLGDYIYINGRYARVFIPQTTTFFRWALFLASISSKHAFSKPGMEAPDHIQRGGDSQRCLPRRYDRYVRWLRPVFMVQCFTAET